MTILNQKLQFVKIKNEPENVFRVLEHGEHETAILINKKRIVVDNKNLYQDFECYSKRKNDINHLVNAIINNL